MSEYSEYQTNQQSNINWGETFKMSVKAPAVADRVFETYDDAEAYVNDISSSAVAGINITVINDDDGTKNGIYYVNNTYDGNGDIVLDEHGLPLLLLYKQNPEQPDWDETDEQSLSYIKNKPYIPDFGNIRTINHEDIIGDGSDLNIHDGYTFPNCVQDYDGNWYSAVVIGDQVWINENLKAEHSIDGVGITNGGSSSSYSAAYLYDYESSHIPFSKRGFLYNFAASQKQLLPSLWKIPDSSDFESLIEYLGKQKRFIVGNNPLNIGKSLSYPEYWSMSDVANSIGNNLTLNGYSGFFSVPAGNYYNSGFIGDGENCDFWTKTSVNSTNAYYMRLEYSSPLSSLYQGGKSFGRSVRYLSVMNPFMFRVWYVNQYGCMQNVSSDYGEYNLNE